MAMEAVDLKKDSRMNLRLSAQQKATIDAAAHVRAKPTSTFAVDAAVTEAERVLSERTVFFIDAERWDAFNAALDRPAMEKPALRALLQGPSIFTRD